MVVARCRSPRILRSRPGERDGVSDQVLGRPVRAFTGGTRPRRSRARDDDGASSSRSSCSRPAAGSGELKSARSTEPSLGGGGALRHLRNRLAHGLPSESEPKDGPAVGPEALPRLEQLRDALMRLGDDVDLLETDTKWSAFLSEFERRGAQGAVVFCDFAETAAYVANRLQEVGVDALQLSESAGLAPVDERSGVVLVSRDELLLGLELRHARVAYNYDLPRSQRRAHIRWSRLDWSRTDPPVEMVTMLDRRNASPTRRCPSLSSSTWSATTESP